MGKNKGTDYEEKFRESAPCGPGATEEEKELARRWPIALCELKSLAARLKDISRPNPEPIHHNLELIEKKRLADFLAEALSKDRYPGLKRSVARRMADRIGDYLLWRRESSIPFIHELIVLLPWWISNLPGAVVKGLREIGLEYVLNGKIIPIQVVWEQLLASDPVYIGHCACRSSGVVDDLKKDGRTFCLVSGKENRQLADRLADRYESLKMRYGKAPDTDDVHIEFLERLISARRNGDSSYGVEMILEKTYPHWEFLPVKEDFTQSWIRSLHKNKKAHMIHPELAFEFATILYLARGTIFTSMRLFDTPYTICSCPSPENDGGCTLTNWYYYGMSNKSLLPNESGWGRRKDNDGQVLHCDKFEIRSRRKCIGCGCKHNDSDPRGVKTVLAQADEFIKKRLPGQR